MTQALVDTSVLIARESGRPLRREAIPDELAVSYITVGELRAGVLAAGDTETRDRRLRTLLVAMSLDPVPIDGRVAEAWARLRVALAERGMRLPVNDSWIAATAIALGVPLLTQDDDYADAPDLDVIRV